MISRLVEQAGTRMSGGFRYSVWAGVLVIVIAAAAAWYFLPVRDWLHAFNAWATDLGAWAPVVFAIVYVIVVIVLAPAEIMSLAAGFIFGAWGFPIVVVSATVGATLAFLLSRYAARDRVRAFVRKRPLLQAIDRAAAEEGWKIMLLLRLNPLVPFNLQNYFFGVTEVGLVPYLLSTFFGIMPGAAMYVYFGTLGQAVTSGESHGAVKTAVLMLGLLATAGVIFLISRKARAKLQAVGISDRAAPRKG
jgi:uncharacterized membrane protein YdjX (TVP38/TMEM64 family)